MTGNAGAEFLVHVPRVLTATGGAPRPGGAAGRPRARRQHHLLKARN